MSTPLARVLIKKECREEHGIGKAFNKACEELKKSYLLWVKTKHNRDSTFTIELHCKP